MTHLLWRRLVVGGVLALALAVTVLVAVNAQSGETCQMSGYVLDPQGRGVPQAQVILKVGGRAVPSSVPTNLDGSYLIQLPALIAQETGYLYARLASGDVIIAGHVNFKRCRARRDIFTNQPTGTGYQPGPTPATPPPVLPAYPGPDAPDPNVRNAVAFFDLAALPRGGVSPNDEFRLPICVAVFEEPLRQISKLTFIAEYDPAKVTIQGFEPIPSSPFKDTPIRAEYQTASVQGRDRGRIWYEVETQANLVELPMLPTTCLPVVNVKMKVTGVQPGDSLGFSTIKALSPTTLREVSTSVRYGPFEGPIARSTTYLDILTPGEQQDVYKRTYLPLIDKATNLR